MCSDILHNLTIGVRLSVRKQLFSCFFEELAPTDYFVASHFTPPWTQPIPQLTEEVEEYYVQQEAADGDLDLG